MDIVKSILRKSATGEFSNSIDSNTISSNPVLMLLRSFVSDLYRVQIQERALLLRRSNKMVAAEEGVRRWYIHNYPGFNAFFAETAAHVREISGVAVAPTYSFLSIYPAGADLHRHVDRAGCDLTLAMFIAHHFRTETEVCFLNFVCNGRAVSVKAKPGDAVLFAGRELTHWRSADERLGEMTTLLFHFELPNDHWSSEQ